MGLIRHAFTGHISSRVLRDCHSFEWPHSRFYSQTRVKTDSGSEEVEIVVRVYTLETSCIKN